MSNCTIAKIPAIASAEEICAAIHRDGIVIVSGLLHKNEFEQLNKEIDPLFQAAAFSSGEYYGKRTKRIHSLVAKSSTYRKLAVHPTLLEVMNKLLLPFCDSILISGTQGIQIWPGEIEQILHREETKIPVRSCNCEYIIHVILACDKFTKSNGGTKIAIGSHKWSDKSRRPTEKEISYAEMDPGEAIIFVGGLIHAGGANTTDNPRAGIVLAYCLGWLRQGENQYLAAPVDVARNFDPKLQDLLGYAVHRPNVGMYEGNTPKILFQAPEERQSATTDWLTAEQQEKVRMHYASRVAEKHTA